MKTLPDFHLFGVTWVVYPTDTLVWASVLAIVISSVFAMRKVFWQQAFRKVVSDGKAVWCFGMLVLLVSISLIDSVHFKQPDNAEHKAGENISLLDKMCIDLISQPEQSYSAPMARKLFTKRVIRTENGIVKDHPPLAYGGRNFTGPDEEYPAYVKKKAAVSLFIGGLWGLLPAVLTIWLTNIGRRRLGYKGRLNRNTKIGVVAFWVISSAIAVGTILLSKEFHVFGTDKVGISTLWTSLKSYRTAFIIGSLTTIIAAVPAVVFGLFAGYLRGWVDDAVQYVYTTLSSIPNILLIGAAMLIVQTSLANASSETIADQSMLYLCLVLGLTSWAGLCRLVRGEVMKLRDIEYVQAARAMGLSKHAIMWRHLFPNVMHIILINMVLRFSALILTEAVLAYIGIGVHPSTQSFGNMIVSAQEQLSRDPVISWNLIAAFVFLLALVIPANLFGDAVRDALDPRLEEVE